jgi:hypothetical protein
MGPYITQNMAQQQYAPLSHLDPWVGLHLYQATKSINGPRILGVQARAGSLVFKCDPPGWRQIMSQRTATTRG